MELCQSVKYKHVAAVCDRLAGLNCALLASLKMLEIHRVEHDCPVPSAELARSQYEQENTRRSD